MTHRERRRRETTAHQGADDIVSLHARVVRHRLTQLISRIYALPVAWEPFQIETSTIAPENSGSWCVELEWSVDPHELYKESRTCVRELLYERLADSMKEPTAREYKAIADDVNSRKNEGWKSYWQSKQATLVAGMYLLYELIREELGLSAEETACLVHIKNNFIDERWLYNAESVRDEWSYLFASDETYNARTVSQLETGIAELR